MTSGVCTTTSREQLDEVLEQERAGMDRRIQEARASGDERRREIVENLAQERGLELELMPDDLAGRVQSLQQYDFMDDDARAQFEELMDELRQQLMQSYFNQMSEGMQNVSPEQMARMKDMLAELNQMLEQRERGEEPNFARFMDRFGDFFPGNPETLDELLEQMAQSMAAMQQLLNSMTPEQRAQLQQLSEALLEDMDLRWQMGELSRNLQQAFPNMNWGRQLDFSGDQPMSMGQMSSVLQTIGDLDSLEQMLQSVTQPGQLAEVDLDQARDLLGDDAARSLQRLQDLAQMLKEAGLIDQRDGRYELTPKGVRALGQKALGDLFRKMMKERAGRHDVERTGIGHERAYEHKPYEFGDPFHLNVEQTVRNAIWRQGSGTPVRLSPEDFEVERTEVVTRSSTVLMLDVSMSMPMRDNFLPAKKVAMALHSLITTQFPHDYFGLVSFGRVARDIKPQLLPELGLGLRVGHQHAARAAARAEPAQRQSGTKQIIMVTDGEPTAHIERGEAVFPYPPSYATIEQTLREVRRCTRAGIRINTFMLDESPYLQDFVQRMMEMNRGRAFFVSPETLGDYVLVDFLEHRTAHRRARPDSRSPGTEPDRHPGMTFVQRVFRGTLHLGPELDRAPARTRGRWVAGSVGKWSLRTPGGPPGWAHAPSCDPHVRRWPEPGRHRSARGVRRARAHQRRGGLLGRDRGAPPGAVRDHERDRAGGAARSPPSAGPVDTFVVAGGDRAGIGAVLRTRRCWPTSSASPGVARRVASVCSGAFVLAAAGLLDGRRATTHWSACDALARLHPLVRSSRTRSSCATAGSRPRLGSPPASTSRSRSSRRTAATTSPWRSRASSWCSSSARVVRPSSALRSQAQAADCDDLPDIQAWIAAHLGEDLSVTALAGGAAMSPRHFARVFRAASGITPARFVERARVEAARRRLEESDLGVDAVAHECGFGSSETMRRSFLRALRVAPTEYRRRFRVRSHCEEATSMGITIGIVVFEDCEELDWAGRGRSSPWRVSEGDTVVTIGETPGRCDAAKVCGSSPITPSPTRRPLDVLVVPGGQGSRRERENPAMFEFLRRVAPGCSWVTSVCTGSFVLDGGGLVGEAGDDPLGGDRGVPGPGPGPGRLEDVRYVRDGNVVTSAGVSAGIDMSLWLVGQLSRWTTPA